MVEVRQERVFAIHPKLTAKQMAAVAKFATPEHYRAHEVLIHEGSRQHEFYVVLGGEIEILQHRGGQEIPLITYRRGCIVGEVATLSGEVSLVEVRAKEDSEVLAVPPENLHRIIVEDPELSDIILRSFVLRRARLLERGEGFFRIVGSRYSQETIRIRDFFVRNGYPVTFLDLEAEEGVAELLEQLDVSVDETPVVIARNDEVLRNPSLEQIARCVGLRVTADEMVYDVLVVGAGPAGLAAAVYAASEGLSVIVIDSVAPGGQAGRSSKIENYLGFPTGISGEELTRRAQVQAQKFGARISVPAAALKLYSSDSFHAVAVSGEENLCARTVVIASGAEYRRPSIPGCRDFEGRGVYYGATLIEAQLCQGCDVIVVGGGNAAGQAAVYLSKFARAVHVVIRASDLTQSMSRYLIRRIEEIGNITLHCHAEITEFTGTAHLEQVAIRASGTGETRRYSVDHVFMMIGVDPNTSWLDGYLVTDAKGFIKTGANLTWGELQRTGWPLRRQPFLLETSRPGVFAAGDVRADSTKRVASAVGEGSICVQFVHEYLGAAATCMSIDVQVARDHPTGIV